MCPSEQNVSSIPELEAEVKRLSAALNEARDRLRQAREEAVEFRVGDVVQARRKGADWGEAIIRRVDAHGWVTGYRVSFRKKNGEFSEQIRHVFSDVRPA